MTQYFFNFLFGQSELHEGVQSVYVSVPIDELKEILFEKINNKSTPDGINISVIGIPQKLLQKATRASQDHSLKYGKVVKIRFEKNNFYIDRETGQIVEKYWTGNTYMPV